MHADVCFQMPGHCRYPFLRPFIEELVPAGVEIHDPAPAVISRAASLMNQPATLTVPEGGKYRFCTTGSASEMQKALRRLLSLNGVVQDLSDLTTQSNSLPGRLTSAIS